MAQLAAIWTLTYEVNHLIGDLQSPLWMQLLDNYGFHWPTLFPISKKRLESEICENFPMLEAEFQQAEAENDKI